MAATGFRRELDFTNFCAEIMIDFDAKSTSKTGTLLFRRVLLAQLSRPAKTNGSQQQVQSAWIGRLAKTGGIADR
jgi:hypothetical protein